jgi:hypothetical protein
MALLVPNNGEGDAAGYFVNKQTPQDLVLKAYQNNVTPAETDTSASYTVATFTGYGDITLTGASWTITEGAPTTVAYAQQTFTSSAGSQSQNIYGYYMVRATSGRIALAERFTDGPYSIVNNGDLFKVTPTITFD